MNITKLNCTNENINIDTYIEFRNRVKESMPHPDWLGDFEKEDIVSLLNNNSKIWLYYSKTIPVCSMMLIPADEHAIRKFDLNIDYKEVADYGPMFVNPKFIGNKLQYQMLKELDKYCSNIGYKYAISTVHPDNTYSINNLIADGFEYKNTIQFTRGTRNIYLKKLN